MPREVRGRDVPGRLYAVNRLHYHYSNRVYTAKQAPVFSLRWTRIRNAVTRRKAPLTNVGRREWRT